MGSRSFKSMFTSQMVSFDTRSLINSPYKTNTATYITDQEYSTLKTIEQLYTSPLSEKNYTNIPVDLTQYLRLREIVNNAQIKYGTDSALAILFQITVDAITGSINAYGLNTLNVQTQVQNTYLQGVLEEIINGVNVKKAFDENNGTLSMTKSFELAPLFRYYINLYGVPAIGVGFDPVKLALVLSALENSGIDPYK